MSKGLNKVQIIGRLGQDPDLRYMTNGNSVANLSVATTESWRDRDSGNRKDRTEWHRVVMYGKGAEIAAKYLTKGSKIFIEGKLQTRKWEDKNGIDRYTTEIVGREMIMLDGRPDNQERNDPYPQDIDDDDDIPF